MTGDIQPQHGLRAAASLKTLFIEDRLKLLVPNWLYFPYKIQKESHRAEPELALLRDLVRPGCTAIDVGANRGFYSYALSAIAGRVEAFEPNPALVGFTRAKARRKTRVHAVALSNREGTAPFYIPHAHTGGHAHLLGNLGNVHRTPDLAQIDVPVATLDSFGFDNVGFIKIDVEGSELEVMEGATRTIGRDRPNLIVELLTRTREQALDAIARIESEFGYVSWIRRAGAWHPARAALDTPRETIRTNNVLFKPKV